MIIIGVLSALIIQVLMNTDTRQSMMHLSEVLGLPGSIFPSLQRSSKFI